MKGQLPNIEIWLLHSCKVISNTSSIVYSNDIYNNYLSKIKIFHDLKNPLVQTINSIAKKDISLYISKYSEKKDDIVYINLLHEHSHNYYHFMFELLPKFILICEYLKNNDKYANLSYILFLDENIPNQFFEVIEYFATIKYTIELVPKHSMIECENIIFCTDFWDSLDNTRFRSNIVEDFFVDSFAIETIKNKLYLNLITPYRKVYLQRKNNQARYLSNTNELEELLKSLNFEFIFPETLSFQEQIQIFSESKIVLGVSGAVFSNIIFMQEDTNAVIFSPDTIAANYYVFQLMADVAKVNLVHILTKNSFNDSIHTNSYIEINEVLDYLNNLVKQ